MQRIIFITFLIVNFNAFADTDNLNAAPQNKDGSHHFFVESIYENSSDAIIYGAQTGLLSSEEFNSVNFYLGLGFMSVDLLKKDYKFKTIRGFLGVSPNWTIAPYMEFGFDVLEEIFNACNDSNEDYCSTDPSFSVGLRWQLSSQLMINAYHKWYKFDGYILDTTRVNVTGISLGARF